MNYAGQTPIILFSYRLRYARTFKHALRKFSISMPRYFRLPSSSVTGLASPQFSGIGKIRSVVGLIPLRSTSETAPFDFCHALLIFYLRLLGDYATNTTLMVAISSTENYSETRIRVGSFR